MVVFILEKVPVTLRGELSRWLIEPRAGVFVGDLSAMVRDRLWEMVVEKLRGGGALLLYTFNNEQGFRARSFGDTTRALCDCDGLTLVHIPTRLAQSKGRRSVAVVVDGMMEGGESVVLTEEVSSTDSRRSVRRSPVSRPPRERPMRKTHPFHPLYGPHGPAETWEIPLHVGDPQRTASEAWEATEVETIHEASFGVRWRPVVEK